MYVMKLKNKVLTHYVNNPCHKVAHYREFHSFLFSEAIWGKHWEEDVGLSGPVLLSNISNCLMLILHRQLGIYLLNTGDSYDLTAQQIHNYIKSMFETCKWVDYSLG